MPSQPVQDAALFAGRGPLLRRIIRALQDQHLHVVIYGDRGIGKTSILQAIELNGEAVPMNKAAFLWGRRAVTEPAAVEALVKPRPEAGSDARRLSQSLDEMIKRRIVFLTAYQDAAYAARYLAKNVVASGLAKRCVIQLSYAIGVARPLSIYVNTMGTGEAPEAEIERAIAEVMDLTPRGIRTQLGLNRPIYQRTSAYGHFGRTPDNEGGFSWERTDLTDALRAAM